VKDKPGYFVSSYQPIKAETFIPQDVSCPYNHPGRLVIENRPVRVVQLISWDYEGKLFMYEVFYALQVIYHGTRTELAAESQWQFFDVDGSGRFTVMRPVDRNPFAPEMIVYDPVFIVGGAVWLLYLCLPKVGARFSARQTAGD
jgi:hypothetical protein